MSLSQVLILECTILSDTEIKGRFTFFRVSGVDGVCLSTSSENFDIESQPAFSYAILY